MFKWISRGHILLALVFFGLVLALFGYLKWIDEPPQSTHLWRQSDSASLALNYHNDGMHFFSPEIHNQHADEGKSGHAVSENPYLYYTVAALYNVFGHHEYVYRGFWSLLLILGFISLYYFLVLLKQSKVVALIAATLLITAPVLIFYGNSYVPNVPALCFVLTGWMFFGKYMQNGKVSTLYLVALCFLLGGLLKVTALISFFTLVGIWLLERFGLKLGRNKQPAFKQVWATAMPFLLVLGVLLVWYIWAWNYNDLHQTRYFSMRVCPIWDTGVCCDCTISTVLDQIELLWLPHLASHPMRYFLAAVLLFVFLHLQHADRLLLAITTFIFLGTLSFIIIWFSSFHDHDYYMINLFIFPFVLVILALDIVRSRYPGLYGKFYFAGALAVLMVYGLKYTHDKQHLRYLGWMNYEHVAFEDVRTVAPLIEGLGIEEDDLIISIPDRTPNYTLYLLERKGWTSFETFLTDSTNFKRLVGLGAKYLFINNYDEVIQSHGQIEVLLDAPIFVHNKLHIYRLDQSTLVRDSGEALSSVHPAQ
jgi:hypothetical protein